MVGSNKDVPVHTEQDPLTKGDAFSVSSEPSIEELAEPLIAQAGLEPSDPKIQKALRDVLNNGQIQSIVATHSGPLPPPSVLKGYESVLPGAAERILCMAEKQADHRRGMEREYFDLEKESARATSTLVKESTTRGLNYAFILCLCCILAGTFLVHRGHEWSGAILTGLTALAGVFIYGSQRSSQAKEPRQSEDS